MRLATHLLVSVLSISSALAIAGCGKKAEPEGQDEAKAAAQLELSDEDRAVLASLEGTWKHDGPDDEAAVAEAIEAVTAEMPKMIRGIATKKIEEAATIDAVMVFKVDGVAIEVERSERKKPFRAVPDGKPFEYENDKGELTEGTLRFEAGNLVQTGETKQGGGEYRFVVEDDKLTVQVRMYSDRMPQDIEFDVHYTKQ